MKFSDLPSAQRSVLAMLCTGQSFNTAELGRCMNPKQDASMAATTLMDMRTKGLLFSAQKPVSQNYADWRATDYGKAVYESRPADVAVLEQVREQFAQSSARISPSAYTYVVYKASLYVGNGYQSQHPTEEAALAEAARLTNEKQTEFLVAKLIARVKPVTQPTHTIERV